MDSATRIEEAAAEWLARRDGERWSSADEAEFDAWLNVSTAHRVAYLRLDLAWQQANRLKALGAGRAPGLVPAAGEWRQSPYFEAAPMNARPSANQISDLRVHPLRAMAATVLIAVAVSLAVYWWPSGPSYRTAVGGLAAVPMVDGSRITLNTDSEVRVTVSAEERRVELEQGEAFFEVAKDPARPFVVVAGDERFVAVGTKFSVLRNDHANRLIVTEGRVRIEDAPALLSTQTPAVTEVAAGGVARSGDAGILVQERPVAEAEVMLSWRSGYLVFKGTPLAEAVAEFNRYNEKKIVIEDAGAAGILIGGNFRSGNVDAFIRLLEEGLPIRVERQEERFVLRSR